MGSCASSVSSRSQIHPLQYKDGILYRPELIDIRGKKYIINMDTYEVYNYETLEYIGVYDEYHLRIVK